MQCGPEYKLPGLYVVDSVVRQSRHQFGTEKDVFGPRFSKNFDKTFRNLFLCTPSDQVIRCGLGMQMAKDNHTKDHCYSGIELKCYTLIKTCISLSTNGKSSMELDSL